MPPTLTNDRLVAKHTAGPWRSDPTYPAGEFVVTSTTAFGPGKNQLRNVAHVGTEEDARLIAAAPGLLAACENIINDLRHMRDTGVSGRSRDEQIAELRAAIAKAGG